MNCEMHDLPMDARGECEECREVRYKLEANWRWSQAWATNDELNNDEEE